MFNQTFLNLTDSTFQSSGSIASPTEENQAWKPTSAIPCSACPCHCSQSHVSALIVCAAIKGSCRELWFQISGYAISVFLTQPHSYHETATFADSQLTDALKQLASDPSADKRVYKKLLMVLGSWRDQFKGDPSMTLVAGLYKQCRGEGKRLSQQEVAHLVGISPTLEDKRKTEKEQKEEAKRKVKQEKQENERRRREEEERRRTERTEGNKPKRARFQFEKVHSLLAR
jgi:hypothetical protein